MKWTLVLPTNLADLLHADGQREAAMVHLEEAARRFAAVDAGDSLYIHRFCGNSVS